ncbi:hypothetical protein SEA_MINIFLAYER_24 [Satellite phage MiniFlayer]|nr:hypothetical protein SEA_MINIFLAYER_24 [Satellite phage MiniFlayer]
MPGMWVGGIPIGYMDRYEEYRMKMQNTFKDVTMK